MFKHGADLFKRNARKPFDELPHRCTVLQVLKKSRHRHSGTCEHPRATDPLWVTFYGCAGRPIDHGKDGSTCTDKRATLSRQLALQHNYQNDNSHNYPNADVCLGLPAIRAPTEVTTRNRKDRPCRNDSKRYVCNQRVVVHSKPRLQGCARESVTPGVRLLD